MGVFLPAPRPAGRPKTAGSVDDISGGGRTPVLGAAFDGIEHERYDLATGRRWSRFVAVLDRYRALAVDELIEGCDRSPRARSTG